MKIGQKGFTLAEGMVTAGLLGVVSLAMLQGLKEDSKTKQIMRREDSVQAVIANIDYYLKDGVACGNTLSGKSRSSANVAAIKKADNTNATFRNESTGADIELTSNAILLGNSANPDLTIIEMRVASFKQYFTINSRDSGGTGTTRSDYGLVELQIDFEQVTQNRTVEYTRAINITVSTNQATGLINHCVNEADLMALQLKEKVCGQSYEYLLGTTPTTYIVGSYNPNTGDCGGIPESLRTLGSEQLCRELGGHYEANPAPPPAPPMKCVMRANYICPNGIQKFKSDGNPECVP